MVNIGKNLRSLRKRKFITQMELAERLGTEQAVISRWEKEICYPSLNYVVDIADFFNVNIDELVRGRL